MLRCSSRTRSAVRMYRPQNKSETSELVTKMANKTVVAWLFFISWSKH